MAIDEPNHNHATEALSFQSQDLPTTKRLILTPTKHRYKD